MTCFNKYSPLFILLLLGDCGQDGGGGGHEGEGVWEGTTFIPGRCDTGRVEAVREIIDGDTISLDNYIKDYGAYEKVRYIGIDTPEYNAGICYERAREFNASLVEGEDVILEIDEDCIDDYYRTLAYVWVGDMMVNRELVCEGYAELMTIPPNTKYREEFEECLLDAKGERRGLWAYGCF